MGEKYIALAASLEGLPQQVPLYKITEGNEPCFFTTYFSWDSAKAIVQGNSFQKKVMLLFGISHAAESPNRSNGSSQGGATQRASALAALSSAFNPSSSDKSVTGLHKSNGSSPDGPTQRAAALAALSSAFNPSASKKTSPLRTPGSGQGSQRAAALAALSSALTAEKKSATPDASPVRANRSPSPPQTNLAAALEAEILPSVVVAEESQDVPESVTDEKDPETQSKEEESEPEKAVEPETNACEGSQTTFTYEQLRAKSDNPVTGIDFKRRETYLSEEEFQTVFGVTKEGFYKLPRWKQDNLKRKLDLF